VLTERLTSAVIGPATRAGMAASAQEAGNPDPLSVLDRGASAALDSGLACGDPE
jgi:hypothetical protein